MSAIIKDLGTVDLAAGGTTTPLEITFQHGFSIAPTVTGTPSIATYTVEVSHDNVAYFDYKTLGTNVAVTDAIEDNTINWGFLRILVTPGGTSTGNVQFSLQVK